MTANQNPEISKWFTQFSEQGRDSAIYHFLSLKIADDAAILDSIRNYTPPNTTQPVPNLFFAAILFISSRDRDRGRKDLSQYFPTLGGKTDLSDAFYETFRRFALDREREIGMIVQRRFVQTNEVRRSCILLPAVGGAWFRSDRPHIHLMDIGTSSGLNLLMDRYECRYSDGTSLGTPVKSDTGLPLSCKSTGLPKWPLQTPPIGRRIGVDLNPIDLRSADERLWATSLIWPDQVERYDRLAGAIRVFETWQKERPHDQFPVALHRGSAIELFPVCAAGIPTGEPIAVTHSFVLNQFTEADRVRFKSKLSDASRGRSVFRIGLEWIGTKTPELTMEEWRDNKHIGVEVLARCHHHGEWIEWLS